MTTQTLLDALKAIETHVMDEEATDAQKLGRIGDILGDVAEILAMEGPA